MQKQQQQQQQKRDEPAWHEEWKSLTSRLDNSHTTDFVRCFWKCM
jgi:hypothetical protein